MSAVNQVLALLENGEWRKFEDIKNNCSIPDYQIKTVLNFLENHGFLQRKDNGEVFRLLPKLVDLFRLDKETEY